MRKANMLTLALEPFGPDVVTLDGTIHGLDKQASQVMKKCLVLFGTIQRKSPGCGKPTYKLSISPTLSPQKRFARQL